MKSKTNGTIQRTQKLNHVQGEGPNWVLIVGGALLSTLSIKLGCKLKQAFECKRSERTRSGFRENGTSMARRRLGACPLHSNLHCFTQNEDNCYHCLSGISQGGVDINKRTPTSPMSKEGDLALPLVAVEVTDSTKKNGGPMWVSSPERLELPRKPFHNSNSSDSPCASESGSDIFSKREVIHKLRQQLKRRDEMIMDMQAQITDFQNSLCAQISQSVHLQSRLDSANHDLFDSHREIQRLRKAIADHCVAEAGSPQKPATTQSWHAETVNGGYANGYLNGANDSELRCVGVEKGRDAERVENLKREVGELKEVIEGKEFLLQSYKEQKVELCTKVKELQLRLATSQVPNIL